MKLKWRGRFRPAQHNAYRSASPPELADRSLVPTPSLGNSDSGLEAIAAIPGGGMWAVGETGAAKGNYSTLIEYHP